MMIKELSKGVFFKLFDFIRPLVVIPFFIRKFGIEPFGIYTQIIFVSVMLYPILDLGIGMSIQRFSKILLNKGAIRGIFTIHKAWVIIIALLYVFVIGFPSVQKLLFANYRSGLIIIAVLFYFILFSMNNTLQGIMRAENKITKLVLIRGIFAVSEAFMLLSVIFFYKKFDFVYIITMGVSQLFYFLLLNKVSGNIITAINIKIKLTKETTDFFKYSLLLIPVGLLGWVTSSIDRFFITHYFGLENTGYYSAVAQYTGYMKLIVFPFTFVLFKDLSKLYDKNFHDFLKLYRKAFFILIGFSFIFLISFYFLRIYIFKYYVGLTIKPELSVLTLMFLITFFMVNVSSFFSTYILVIKKNKIILLIIIISAFINFTLNKFILIHYTYVFAVFFFAFSIGIQVLIAGLYVVINIQKHEKGTLR